MPCAHHLLWVALLPAVVSAGAEACPKTGPLLAKLAGFKVEAATVAFGFPLALDVFRHDGWGG